VDWFALAGAAFVGLGLGIGLALGAVAAGLLRAMAKSDDEKDK
jgi:hypothetical protein